MLKDFFPNANLNESVIAEHTSIATTTGDGLLGPPKSLKQMVAFTRNGAWLKPTTDVSLSDDRPIVALYFETGDGVQVAVETVWARGLFEGQLRFKQDGVHLESIEHQSAAVLSTNRYVSQSLKPSDEYFERAASQPESNAENTWFDNFAYCTWNSLGLNLTLERVINQLTQLNDAGINPKTLVLDDGWQRVDGNRHLVENSPSADKFPGGLAAVVEKSREKGIEQVLVWTDVVGYWNGFAKGSRDLELWEVVHQGENCLIPSPSSVEEYYNKFFKDLAGAGISGVKIDNDNFLDEITAIKNPSLPNVADAKDKLQASYCRAIAKSANTHKLQVNWSMCMVPYLLTEDEHGDYRQLPVAGAFRNSDDFFPDDPNSHLWHVFCNFFNSYYTGRFTNILDFDMFQTRLRIEDTPFLQRVPSLHAVARALSGGPISITDYPNTHNPALFKALTVSGFDGKPGKALMFRRPPLLFDPYCSFGEATAVKVSNAASAELGEVGILNLSTSKVSDEFEVPRGLIAYSFKGGRIVDRDAGGEADNGNLNWDLESGDWDLVFLSKYHRCLGSDIAILGFIDKYAGIAAIKNVSYEEVCLRCELTGGNGRLALYVRGRVNIEVRVDGKNVDFKTQGNLVLVDIPSVARSVSFVQIL